jgi:cellulose biosynthesis protein BcsQ
MFVASLYNLKGGVGKTASCVNFAYMAAKDGYRTLLWDLDPQGAASYYYKAHASVKSSVKKIVEHSLNIREAIVLTEYEGLDIIPADISARKLDILLDGHHGSKKYFKTSSKKLPHPTILCSLTALPAFQMLRIIFFTPQMPY